jgi:hypothetical protein
MREQVQGIAMILFSILLTLTFEAMNIKNVFDLDLYWAHVFLLMGIIGMVMVFYKPKNNDK